MEYDLDYDFEPADIDGDTEGALASAGFGLEESYVPGGITDEIDYGISDDNWACGTLDPNT